MPQPDYSKTFAISLIQYLEKFLGTSSLIIVQIPYPLFFGASMAKWILFCLTGSKGTITHNIMPQILIPQRRLNVSLLGDDAEILVKLRDIYEKELDRRISWAEVIRIACKRQAELEVCK